MIDVQNLIYDYPGHRALRGVGFRLAAQSITALVGPNGAGKTTLLRCIAALDEPMGGRILLNGMNVQDDPRRAHRMMGYLPDHFGLYQNLSAQRCLEYAAWAHGLDGQSAPQAILWAARQVALEDMLHMRAGDLSRGQRQRLALAQAIVHRPHVLLLDEPGSGLDPASRADLSRLMRALAAAGMTLLISSHILAELEEYCSAMLVLENGRLLAHQQLHATADDPEKTGPRVLRLRLPAANDVVMLQSWLQSRGLPYSQPQAGQPVLLVELPHADDDAQVQFAREALGSGCRILELTQQTRTLQDVYMHTVGASRPAANRSQT